MKIILILWLVFTFAQSIQAQPLEEMEYILRFGFKRRESYPGGSKRKGERPADHSLPYEGTYYRNC